MSATETAIAFQCSDDWLVGIIHRPKTPARRAVVIVVGGPQYRVGSHRQFVLLARALAKGGYAVLRFDYRGMGDSCAVMRTFEDVGGDIKSAIDVFCQKVPEIDEIVLWGLCDAASAGLFYASDDPRVVGVVALNPWVRTEAGEAEAYLRHYYWSRLLDAELWRKICHGRFDLRGSLSSLVGNVRKTIQGRRTLKLRNAYSADRARPLPERVFESWRRFSGRVLLILSGDDLTAAEFKNVAAQRQQWQSQIGAERVTRHDLDGANHTFSRAVWRDQVADWTSEWLRSW